MNIKTHKDLVPSLATSMFRRISYDGRTRYLRAIRTSLSMMGALSQRRSPVKIHSGTKFPGFVNRLAPKYDSTTTPSEAEFRNCGAQS